MQLLIKATQVEYEQYLEDMISAHRCTGITAEIITRGKVRVHYETCYKGMLFAIP